MRVIVISENVPYFAATASSISDKVRPTSAKPAGFLFCEPLNTISSISAPRSSFAFCSPNTQRTASIILLFPLPLGPTIAVIPSGKSTVVLSTNDLKP